MFSSLGGAGVGRDGMTASFPGGRNDGKTLGIWISMSDPLSIEPSIPYNGF
jgi:hypothetical protein